MMSVWMGKNIKLALVCVCLCVAQWALASPDVQVKGLFKGSAVLMINGKQRLLKVGKTSPEGVRLVAATSKTAEIEVDGERRVLSLSRRITGSYKKPELAEVRIQSGYGGHHYTPGRINGLAVDFLVDTGATYVSMNMPTAKRLGINYRAGKELMMSTANGSVKAYRVKLDSVTVGSVKVNHVWGVVNIGNSPEKILLGNSYLSRVEMKIESGVLVLTSKL